MLRYLVFACIAIAPATSWAGDPCPIEFTVYDLGAAPGLDRDALLSALQSKDGYAGLTTFVTDRGVVALPTPGGPAAAAGLKDGDVIVAVGGSPVTAAEQVTSALTAAAPGDAVPLTVKRGEATVDLALTLGLDDPVVQALLDLTPGRECTAIRRGTLTAGQRAAALEVLVSPEQGLRCRRAHDRLEGFGGGDLFFLRSQDQLLLAHAAWETECAAAADYDGEKLTPQRVEKLLQKVAKKFEADRHANP